MSLWFSVTGQCVVFSLPHSSVLHQTWCGHFTHVWCGKCVIVSLETANTNEKSPSDDFEWPLMFHNWQLQLHSFNWLYAYRVLTPLTVTYSAVDTYFSLGRPLPEVGSLCSREWMIFLLICGNVTKTVIATVADDSSDWSVHLQYKVDVGCVSVISGWQSTDSPEQLQETCYC